MRKKNLAFTVELLGLFILLILVITVITQVFVMSRAHSIEAKRLTEAVILAEDAAEISSSEKDIDALADRLTELYDSSVVQRRINNDGSVSVAFVAAFRSNGNEYQAADAREDNSDAKVGSSDAKVVNSYYVNIDRKYDSDAAQGTGVYAEDSISIYRSEDTYMLMPSDGAEPIYTLTAGKYFGEGD